MFSASEPHAANTKPSTEAGGELAPSPSALEMRATSHGFADFADSEILEFYLARAGVASPGPVASSTMSLFRGLAGVLGASHADLARTTSHRAAVELKLLHEASVRVALAEIVRRDVLTSQSAVAAYLKILLAAQPREQLWVLFLDKRNQLLLSEKIAEGTVDHAPVYPREIVRRALELNCSALILVHNHPTRSNRSRWITHKHAESLGNSRIFGLA